MILEGLAIASFAALNLGGLRWIYKKLQKEQQIENFETNTLNGQEAEKWFTMGSHLISEKFSNSGERYWIRYILKCSSHGKRNIEIVALPVAQRSYLTENAVVFGDYINYLQPWQEGSISLDDLKKALPKLDLVPNKQLLQLK